MSQSLTPNQLELMRHALGLPNKKRTSYRTYYVVGYGVDHTAWTELVALGFAKMHKSDAFRGDDVFIVTRAGAEAALLPDEKLSKEDFPDSIWESVPCPHCGKMLDRILMQREDEPNLKDGARWRVVIAGVFNRAALKDVAKLMKGWAT